MASGAEGEPQPLPVHPIDRDENTPDLPEVLDRASELLKPLLRDPSQASNAVASLFAVIEHHNGPLPHPRILSGYEDVVAGSGREILEMAKAEQRHRHKMENRETSYPYVTLAFGGLALMSCIAGAVFLAGFKGNTNVSIALLSAPLLGAVGWLIGSRLKSDRDDPPTRR